MFGSGCHGYFKKCVVRAFFYYRASVTTSARALIAFQFDEVHPERPTQENIRALLNFGLSAG